MVSRLGRLRQLSNGFGVFPLYVPARHGPSARDCSRQRVRRYLSSLPSDCGPGRKKFLGVVEQLYRMRDRGIPAALRKLNRMRDCVVLMKKVMKIVTVLLPLAARKGL